MRLILVSLVFAPSLLAVAGMGVWSLYAARRSADVLYADVMATYEASALAGQRLDAVQLRSLTLLAGDASVREVVQQQLVTEDLPGLDAALVELRRTHAHDGPLESLAVDEVIAGVEELKRAVLVDLITDNAAPSLVELEHRFAPLRAQLDEVQARERAHAATAHGAVEARYRTGRDVIAAITAVALCVGGTAMYLIARRVVPRALAPEQAQSRFAEVLQVAEDERDAHELLKRHLERAVPGGSAVVMNRNNSANKLEAMTALPEGSPLASTLTDAGLRSCLAVRLARPHSTVEEADPLLQCSVCGTCGDARVCAPLTVGGEVIGSVLVTSSHLGSGDAVRIRQSVMQAAPILANLRNLAVAEQRATTDSLTGLPNRRPAQDTLKRMVAHSSRTLSPLAALLIDLDRFKQINDQFGHAAGDEVLAAVGAVLRSNLRASDFACRQGGEEFLVLLPDTGAEAALHAADKIRAALSAIRISSVERKISASIGVAILPDHAGDGEALQRAADRALYVAKGNGRDRSELALA